MDKEKENNSRTRESYCDCSCGHLNCDPS